MRRYVCNEMMITMISKASWGNECCKEKIVGGDRFFILFAFYILMMMTIALGLISTQSQPSHCHLRYINVGYDPSGRLMNFQCLSPCVFQKVLQLHLSKGFTIVSFEGFVFKKVCQLHLSTGFTIVSFKRFIFQKISQYRCVFVKTFIFQKDYLSNGFIVSFNWFYNASLHCCTILYK